MNSKIYDEWLKINVEIHNKLEKLKKLDKEKDNLIKEAENKGLTEEIKVSMNRSVSKYNLLLEEIKVLNVRSKELNEKIN